MAFCHLHCHTEYSLLDGAIRLPDLFKKAKADGMSHVAITDHGTLFGLATFYDGARKNGLTPILGCEVYVCDDRREKKDRQAHHLVLLAETMEGYTNLMALCSDAYLNGFYYRPRVDLESLMVHRKGIIALSACIQGAVPRAFLKSEKEALNTIDAYRHIFKENFFLEIQKNTLSEQPIINAGLLRLGQEHGIGVVATNDCHYLEKDDFEAHQVLLCIQSKKTIMDKDRFTFKTDGLHFKTEEEMRSAFINNPETIDLSQIIANRCQVELPRGKTFFPAITKDDSPENLYNLMKNEALKGFEIRILEGSIPENERAIYTERLEYEFRVIKEMGFSGYFLIVQEFLQWARDRDIPIGPGRGSAAGSLVVYCLRITNLNPLPWGLLFERFLNSERVSLPDIDVDICERRRGEVIAHMAEKYGEKRVAQICTFGTMKIRMVLKDVGRALGFSPQEMNGIAKSVPDEGTVKLESAFKTKDMQEAVENLKKKIFKEVAGKELLWRNVEALLRISLRLEGLSRHVSVHAAGVVVSDLLMQERVPVFVDNKNREKKTASDSQKKRKTTSPDSPKKEKEIPFQKNIPISQFDMKCVENTGLVKFDFLGLRTMTFIADILKLIQGSGLPVPDLDKIPLDDPTVYALYASGDMDGIFQMESKGMRKYLQELAPRRFEDIIAMAALYRPGPLNSGMVDAFIQRKQGQEKIDYYHLPEFLQPVLETTYGVIVYQEQVMQIAQVMGGYTLGQADLLRRAMGKKNREEMEKERTRFMEGALKKGIAEKLAEKVFDDMEKFAEYGFNKSHSAAYSLISYQTAFLRVYYPVHFMAALLTSEMGNHDNMLYYVKACQQAGIQLLQPLLGTSKTAFTVEKDAVRFGFGGIHGLGEETLKVLENCYHKKFKTPVDFLRFMGNKTNIATLTALIHCGALDVFHISRKRLLASFAFLPAAIKEKNGSKTKQGFLFENEPFNTEFGIPFQEIDELPYDDWSITEKAQREFLSSGVGFSGDPLFRQKQDNSFFQRQGIIPALSLSLSEVQMATSLGITQMSGISSGFLQDVKTGFTKKEQKMFSSDFEDEKILRHIASYSSDSSFEDVFKSKTFLGIEFTMKKNSETLTVEHVLSEDMKEPLRLSIDKFPDIQELKSCLDILFSCCPGLRPVEIECLTKTGSIIVPLPHYWGVSENTSLVKTIWENLTGKR